MQAFSVDADAGFVRAFRKVRGGQRISVVYGGFPSVDSQVPLTVPAHTVTIEVAWSKIDTMFRHGGPVHRVGGFLLEDPRQWVEVSLYRGYRSAVLLMR